MFDCNRRLTLADVSRYTNAQSLINRTVFDLDSIVGTATHSTEHPSSDADTQHQKPKGVDVTLTGIASETQYEPSRDGHQTFASSNPFDAPLTTSANDSSACVNVAECHGPTSTYPNIEPLLVEDGFQESEITATQVEGGGDGEIPHLCIDSCFESGNLRKAIQASDATTILDIHGIS